MTREQPPSIPLAADERTTLLAFLDFYRAALFDRAFELTQGQLQTALPPSSLTLSRLLGHMAFVEYWWFCDRFAGDTMPDPFASLDWNADPNAEMTLAQTLPAAELFGMLDAAIEDSRKRVAEASFLDDLSARQNRAGEHLSLRWILIHMIEEYARHCGHADLIRESIDGDVAS